MNFEPAKAEFAADVVEPFAVAVGEFPLRALLQPADRDDEKAHGYFSGNLETRLPQKASKRQLARAPTRAARQHAPEPLHIGSARIAYAAVGPCVHNLSRL
jgi:hypothetical protein